MNELIPLSPVDHIFTGRGGYPINFIFFFEGSVDTSRLKDSLEKTIERYPPCGARLVETTPNTYVFDTSQKKFSWNVKTVSSDLRKIAVQNLDSLFTQARSVPGEDLLHVTLIHSEEGFGLAVSLSHCVADGYSYFLFLTSWAKVFQSDQIPTPQLDRKILVPEKSLLDQSPDPSSLFRRTGFTWVSQPRDEVDRVDWEILNFTAEKIRMLAQSISKEFEIRLSTNDLLSAELWKKFAQKYNRHGDHLSFSCAVDYRRIHPDLTPFYFGNAIRCAALQMGHEELMISSTADVAVKIGRAVRAIDLTQVKDSLNCLESLRISHGLGCMEHFYVSDPKTGFLVTNLSKLPLLQIDFGSGPPIDFRILTPVRRTAVILPSREGLRVQIAI